MFNSVLSAGGAGRDARHILAPQSVCPSLTHLLKNLGLHRECFFNLKSIGVKYSLIVLEDGNFYHVSVLTSLLVKKTLGICHD